MRMGGVLRLVGGVRRRLAVGGEAGAAGAGEDVGIALAALFVVLAMQPPVARDHALVAGAEQGRALVAGGEIGQRADRGRGGVVDRRAGGRGVGGAAGHAGVRQVGAADPQRDRSRVEAEPVGADLRERGPGALSHIVRAELDQAGAVGMQGGARGRLHHQRREAGGAHAPAHQEPGLVPQRARLQRPRRPAEPLGAARIAVAQLLRGEGLAALRLLLGIVGDAEGQRIHAARFRQFVDRTLQRGAAGRFSRRAHEERRSGIEPDRLVGGAQVGRLVKRMRDPAGRLEEVVERARRGEGVVIDRCEMPVLVGAEAERLPGRRAMPDRAEHLLAPGDQLDRTADQAGGHDAQHLRRPDGALGAEAAAEERALNMDVGGVDAEQAGDPGLRHRHPLARRIEEQPVAVPARHHRVRLHRVVVLRRRVVGRLDPAVGVGQTGRHVAAGLVRRAADADRVRHETLGLVEAGAGRLHRIGRTQQQRAFRGGLQRLGDHHRDRLVGVAHMIVLQQVELVGERLAGPVGMAGQFRRVGGGHHLDHAGMRACGGEVERLHAAMRDAGDRHHRMQHAGRMIVGGEAGGAGDLERAVAAGQRLADARSMPDMPGRLGRERGRKRGGDRVRQRRALRWKRPERRRARPAMPGDDRACRRRRGRTRSRPGAGRDRS